MLHSISDNLHKVRDELHSSAVHHHRDPHSIELLAVSKTKPVSDIIIAYESGHRQFGENYVQEGTQKIAELKDYKDIVWHFIGPLQSNKTRLVADHFDWMQSLDRLKIATRLNEQRSVHQARLQVCVQVNIDNEANKAGVLPDEVLPLLAQIAELPRLQLRGLMAIPEATQDQQKRADSFHRMQQLFAQCQQIYADFDTLSMGMSADYDTAIAHGASMIRVGTGIFGARQPQASVSSNNKE